MSTVPSLSRPALRRLIDQTLRSDSDLDAFCLDYFPALKKRFSGTMDRVAKLNLLFESEPATRILEQLCAAFPEAQHIAVKVQAEERLTPEPPKSSVKTYQKSIHNDAEIRQRSLVNAFLDTAVTRRGLLRVVALLFAISLVLRSAQPSPERIGLLSTSVGALIALLSAASLLKTMWQRWRTAAVSASRFVGPQPMDENDADRFHGRGNKLDEMVHKLEQPDVRHILLFGESGCGKTSLLRAGLLPRLHDKFECVYLRFTDNPVRALLDALRSIQGPALPISDRRLTITEELHQACLRANKPLLICIDQFEEFHNNPIGGPDFQEVLQFIWAISGENASANARLILCLRHDFLHLLTVFYTDRGFARREAKITVEPFEEEVAEEIIHRLLHRDTGGLLWDAELVHRVLNDLIFQRLHYGQIRRYVMPTELQIVFQMVQSRRVRRAEDYPGKKRLLLDYVSEAITTVPAADPPVVKQILLCLIDANGLTKAKPQTLLQLASQAQVRDHDHLRRVLEHLDRNRHIVRSIRPEAGAAQSIMDAGIAYELAHDYLAGVIRVIAGAEMSGAKRSQALLETARLHAAQDRGYRIPISECLHIWRYPAEQMTTEDRVLWQRSLRVFGLLYCLPSMLLVLGVLFVRFATHTIVLQISGESYEAVLVPGINALPPLLSARGHSVATGFIVKEAEWFDLPELSPLLSDLQRGIWRPTGLSFLNLNWNPDRYLRKRISVALEPIMLPRDPQCLYDKSIDDDLFSLFLSSSEDFDKIANHYQNSLICGFAAYRQKCAVSKKDKQCQKISRAMKSMAMRLRDIPNQQQIRQKVAASIAQVLIGSTQSLASINAELDLYTSIEPFESPEQRLLLQKKVVEILSQEIGLYERLDSQTAERLPELLDLLGQARFLTTNSKRSLADIIGGQDLARRVGDVLLGSLQLPFTRQMQTGILDALISINKNDPRLRNHLTAQLSNPDFILRVDAFHRLLRINQRDEAALDYFNKTISAVVSSLKEYRPDSFSRLSGPLAESLAQYASLPQSRLRVGGEHFFCILKNWIDDKNVNIDRVGMLSMFQLLDNYDHAMGKLRQNSDDSLIVATGSLSRREVSNANWHLQSWVFWSNFDLERVIKDISTASMREGMTNRYYLELFQHAGFQLQYCKGAEAKILNPLPQLLATNERLRKQMEALVLQDNSGNADCEWLSVAMQNNLRSLAIDQKIAQKLPRCGYRLTREYARIMLLNGMDDASEIPNGPILEQVFSWLDSPEAERSTSYRQVATDAFEILTNRRKSTNNYREWRDKFRVKLLNDIKKPSTPLRYRQVYLKAL